MCARQDTPVVGRDDELAVLQAAWETVGRRRVRASMVTVIGDAGIGKSRLVRELMDRVGSDARIICGRCLAYGEGITFWPLREMVVFGGGDPRRRLAGDRTRENARLHRRRRCGRSHGVGDRTKRYDVSVARDLLGCAPLHADARRAGPSGRAVRRHSLGRACISGSARKPARDDWRCAGAVACDGAPRTAGRASAVG